MDVEAFMDGYLREIYFQAGDVVPLEAALALISTTADEPLTAEEIPPIPPAGPIETGVPAEHTKTDLEVSQTSPERIVASPVAKQLALEHNVELSMLKGSGPGGRITKEDVEAAIQSRQAIVPEIPASEITSSMRKAIAQRTQISKTTIPHYYVSIDLDMSHVLGYIERAKQAEQAQSKPIPTVTDVVIWACGQVLTRHPYLNASWIGEEIILHDEINIGLVVGVEGGLMVPVVNQANTLDIGPVRADFPIKGQDPVWHAVYVRAW